MTAKERIAYVTSKFPYQSLVFEQNEILGIQRMNVDVTLLSCQRPSAVDLAQMHRFAAPLQQIVRYPSLKGVLFGLAWCALTRGFRFVQSGWRAVTAALRQPIRFKQHLSAWLLAVCYARAVVISGCRWIHADFIQGTATVAWHLSVMTRRPFSMKCHAFDIFSDKAGERESHAFMAKKLKAAALVFSVHRYGMNKLVREFGSDLIPKTRVLMVCVRTEEMKALPYPKASDEKLIVALGRLEEKKGFLGLIQTIAQIRESGLACRCEIYGEGQQHTRLQQEIRKLGLEQAVALKGFYAQEQLSAIFEKAALLCVPSIEDRFGDTDGIPTVIFEAMGFARPVVASDISGIPEVVRQRCNGLLVPPGDSKALAAAIQEILSNPSWGEEMGRVGRAYVVQNHDLESIGRNFMEALPLPKMKDDRRIRLRA